MPLLNLGLVCGCPIAIMAAILRRGESAVVVMVLALVGLVILVGLGLFVARQMLWSIRTFRRATAHDMTVGKVDIMHARITEDEDQEHVIAVDEARGVKVYRAEFERLDRALSYRVYYLPQSRIPLSIEADEAQ